MNFIKKLSFISLIMFNILNFSNPAHCMHQNLYQMMDQSDLTEFMDWSNLKEFSDSEFMDIEKETSHPKINFEKFPTLFTLDFEENPENLCLYYSKHVKDKNDTYNHNFNEYIDKGIIQNLYRQRYNSKLYK